MATTLNIEEVTTRTLRPSEATILSNMVVGAKTVQERRLAPTRLRINLRRKKVKIPGEGTILKERINILL